MLCFQMIEPPEETTVIDLKKKLRLALLEEPPEVEVLIEDDEDAEPELPELDTEMDKKLWITQI